MGTQARRLAGPAALGAGLALVVGSFLPWEHSFDSIFGAKSHSGMDCVCGGELMIALGLILMGLGGLGAAPWVPALVHAIVWVLTVLLSIFAGLLVAILWADVRDDPSTVAVGVGVYVMAAGAILGLIGSIPMWAFVVRDGIHRA
jgi:hypothetical protein